MIIETKLYIPQTNGYLINRAHLFRKLDKGLHTKLSVIIAPAGYGKSTLLSEWVKTLDVNSAWISLDENDNDPIRFWKHIIESLRKASSLFAEHLAFQPISNGQDPTGTASFTKLINLLNQLPEEIIFVWDDFHLVNNQLILDGVKYFLTHIPTSVHIYLVSRTRLSLPLSRMRIENQLNELSVEDLRFHQGEMGRFFTECTDLSFSQDELKAIHDKTEGWIAGMRMLALSMNHTEKGPIEFIKKMNLEHYHVSDYFFEEVFMKLTVEMQQLLLKTSILERMNVDLISALLSDMQASVSLMQQLKRKNLFLISLDNKSTWYRYHHLFQDFLQNKLIEVMPNEWRNLHEIAGKWYEKHNYHEDAMNHYLAGERYIKAIRLLEEIAPVMVHSKLGLLRSWFEQVPDKLLLEQPKLLMNDIFSLLMMGEKESVSKKLNYALEEMTDATFRSGFEMLRLLSVLFELDFERYIELSEDYVQKYPDEELFISLGTEGDLDFPNWSFLDMVTSLKERERIMTRLYDCWSKSKHYFFIADAAIGLGELMYEWNRLEEAEHYAITAKEIGETHQNKILIAISYLLLAQVYGAKGQVERAEEILTGLRAEVNRATYPLLHRFIEMYHTYLLLLRGNDEKALKWLPSSGLHITDEIPHTMLMEYRVYAILLAKKGKVKDAMTLIWRLLREAHRSGRQTDYIHLLIQHSFLLEQNGETTRSFDVLEEALSLAESDEYQRTFIDAGIPFMELLEKYVQLRQKQHRIPTHPVSLTYVKRLLQFKDIQYGKKVNVVRGIVGNVHLTEKETIVLQYLNTSLTNKEIAENLHVSLSTVKTHINNIYGKLQVNNRMGAIERGRQLGLLS